MSNASSEFIPPGSSEGYDRVKRESMNPHMLRAQQQQQQQHQQQQHQSQRAQKSNAPLGNLFGD